MASRPSKVDSMEKKQRALKLRLTGLSYGAIAEKLDVSRQRVQQMLRPPTAVYNWVKKNAQGLCELCGIVDPHGHIHHKLTKTLEEFYHDMENLQYLCPSCHRRCHEADIVAGVDRKLEERFDRTNPVRALINIHGVSVAEVARRVGASESSIRRWKEGMYPPTEYFERKIRVLLNSYKQAN